MSDSPRTDDIDAGAPSGDIVWAYAVMRSHARRLERELIAANAEIEDLKNSLRSEGDHAFYQNGIDGR